METDTYFENVFSNISIITYDYKPHNFQYELVHIILPTNPFLVKIGIKDSDLRSFVKLLQILLCITFVNVLKSKNSVVLNISEKLLA